MKLLTLFLFTIAAQAQVMKADFTVTTMQGASTTITGDLKSIQVPIPIPSPSASTAPGTNLAYGQICPSNQTCNYSGGSFEGTAVTMACSVGVMTVKSASYGANTSFEPCAPYVGLQCNGKGSCSVTFSNDNCVGDPLVGVGKQGISTIQCAGQQASESPSGSTIPALTQLVDHSLNIWTVVGGQTLLNGKVNAGTGSVILLLYYKAVMYQQNVALNWWSSSDNITWTPSSDPRIIPPPVTGQFSISGGKIFDPKGKQYIARGLNLDDFQMGEAITNASAQPLTSLFPGINFIRLNTHSGTDPNSYASFIANASANGIVVEIENHPWPALNALQGNDLAVESAWYGQVASLYKSNPYVWFGSMNEPQDYNGAALTGQHVSTYNAIRNAGSKAVVLFEVGVGAGNPNTVGTGATAIQTPFASYASMSNAAWDMHFYGWIINQNPNQDVANAGLMGSVAGGQGIIAAQTVKTADGIMPVVIGEFGPGIDDHTLSPAGEAVITAVTVTGAPYGGYAAWQWAPDGTQTDIFNLQWQGVITSYGQRIAKAIAATAGQFK